MRKVKKGVVVAVIAGDDKGKNGKVLAVKGDKVIVEGVNVVKKFVKKGLLGKNSEGSIIDMEKPIHISNVKVVDGSEVKEEKPKAEKKETVKAKKTVTKKKAKLDKKEE